MVSSSSKHNDESPQGSKRSRQSGKQTGSRSNFRFSKLRRWIFRILAAIFPFGVVGFANALLYWADVGVDTTLVISNDRVPEGMYYLNPQTEFAYCSEDMHGPEPRSFALPKKQNAFRVLVVGASSVQGYPYPSELSFSRQMELVLGMQLKTRKVEVLNAGIVGMSTKPLSDLVSQAAIASPDVIVLYAGHNEFYGVGGVATNARIGEFGMRTRRYRLVQALSNWIASDNPTSGELITRLPNDLEISIDGVKFAEAQREYEKYLLRIADSCSSAGIPLLMCSVVSNLSDQSPARSADESGQVERQVKELMALERYSEANEILKPAVKQFPNSAVIHYRQAQCLEKLGKPKEASDHFSLARDFDGCRYRAPGSFREIVREVALQRRDAGIYFLDLVPVFADASENSAPGHDLFLDHVHFTIDGHWLMAGTISKVLVEQICNESWNASAVPSQSERDLWLGIRTEDHLVAVGLAYMLLQQPPFDRSIDDDFHFLGTVIDEYVSLLSERERQLFMSLDNGTKIADLLNGLGRKRLSIGDLPGALDFFEEGKRRRPWMPDSYILSAVCDQMLGRKTEAVSNIRRSYQTPLAVSGELEKERNELIGRLGYPNLRGN